MISVPLPLEPFFFSAQYNLVSHPALWGKSAASRTSVPWTLSMSASTSDFSRARFGLLRRRPGVFWLELDILCFKSSVDLVRAVMSRVEPPP